MCFQCFSDRQGCSHIPFLVKFLLLQFHFAFFILMIPILSILLYRHIFGITCFSRNYRQKKLVNMRYLILFLLLILLTLRIDENLYWHEYHFSNPKVFLNHSIEEIMILNEKYFYIPQMLSTLPLISHMHHSYPCLLYYL